MTIPVIQNSYISGELSPDILGRTEKPQYKNGASTMRNSFVSYRGGMYSRAGTAFVGMCKQAASNAGGTPTSNPPRDISYQLSINTGYALEFGDDYMRVKYQGNYVTENAKLITGGITRANLGVITLTAHGYSNGDWVFASGIGGMTEFNSLTFIVQNATTNTFTLTDLFGNAVNTSAYPAYTSGGTFARILTIVSPYAAADLPYLKFTQDATAMNLVCWNQKTDAEYPPYTLQLNGSTWEFTEVSFASSIAPPASISVSATSSTTLNTWYSYVVTAIDSNGNESIASVSEDVQNNDISIYAGSNTITWANVVGATQYNVYSATPSYATGADPGFVGVPYGLIGSAFGLQFVDTNITPDFTTSPPLHTNPFAPGAILEVTPTASGSGLTQANVGYSINTSTGSGFNGTPIVQNGGLVGFVINDGGMDYASTDTMTITGGSTKATGTYTFTANPTNNQTIVLNGVTWTFVTGSPTGNETAIGLSVASTLAGLAADLNASVNTSIDVASYSLSGLVLNITYKTGGTGGNAYTLGAGTYAGAISGTHLTGGASSGGATVSITVGPETGTFPGAVQYYQQRLVYADTIEQPDTYFMSQPGLYSNFDASIPTVDSDAITGTPWGVQINGIQWMLPTVNGLLTLTGNGVWLVNGGSNAAITPSDQSAQAQAQIGCSAIVPPLYINLHALYVQSKNSIVRDIAYNFYFNVFQGTDITVYSNHLFFGYTITQWAYAEEPWKIVWAVRNDGTLLSLTYIKEQEVEGWARHDTNGLFTSVCSVTEPPVDAVYVIVQRYIVGEGVWAYFSERFDNRLWNNNVEQCFCVDAGLTWPISYPAATLYPAAAEGTNNISSTNAIAGGTGYTAPVAFAVDSTGEGNGSVFTVSFTGGVITAVTPVDQGENYTMGATKIVITDPTGSGAVVQPIITNYVNFTASASVFSSVMVGDVIRVDGGKATIVEFVSGVKVVANVTQALTTTMPNDPNFMPVPALSGTWSIATPTMVVTGLNHLLGMEVTGVADGGVIVPQTVGPVAGGVGITLQQPASAINVGLPFIVQGQSMPIEVPSQTTTQGKRGNISNVIMRVLASRGIQVGCNQPDQSWQPNNAALPWSNMTEIKQRNTLIDAGSAIPLFTGDLDVTYITGQWSDRKQIAFQQPNPLPMQVLATISQIEMGDP